MRTDARMRADFLPPHHQTRQAGERTGKKDNTHMNKRKASTAVIVAFYSLGGFVCSANTDSEMRAATVLLGRFESVARTNTDFLLNGFDDRGVQSDGMAGLRLPFLPMVAGLRRLGGPNTEHDIERNYTTVLVGAADFVSPEGLGAVSFRGCYIAVREHDARPDIATAFSQAKYELSQGEPVWTWSMPPYEGHPSVTMFYAAQVARSYFVLTNDRHDLEEIAKELSSGGLSSVPAAVTDWTTLRTHQYWVHRSIRRSKTVDGSAAALTSMSSTVVEIALFSDMDGRGRLRVYDSDKSGKTTPKDFRASEVMRFQPAGAGIWQATIPLTKDDAAGIALFQALYFFGFGVST
jgi:hypothetical protein